MKKLLIIGLAIAPVMAITTIEPIDIASKPNGNSNLIDLSYSSSSGNTDKNKLNLKSLNDYSTDTSYLSIIGEYTYGESNGKRNVDKYYIHSRILQKLYKKHIWEIFAQIESNRFQDLSLRKLLGVGMRFKLSESFYFGSGAMIINEKLENLDSKQFSRGSLYIAYKETFNLNIPLKVVYTGYYQPNTTDSSDYRILQNITFTIPLTDTISLNFKAEHAYDSMPPIGIKNRDVSQSTSLSYKF